MEMDGDELGKVRVEEMVQDEQEWKEGYALGQCTPLGGVIDAPA